MNSVRPRDAVLAGDPLHVVLTGVSLCGAWGLVGLSWPDAQMSGAIDSLEADYWAMAPLPGDVPLVAAAGHRPSDPGGVGRIYVIDARTMAVVDSSAPMVLPGRQGTPFVELVWSNDLDRGFVTTYDARVWLYRRSTQSFTSLAANAVWSRIRFDGRRDAVLVLIAGDGFDWPGLPTLQWFADTGEVFPRVDLAGLLPGGSNPRVRDARPDGAGGLLVLTGTELTGPFYPVQTCRVFRVNDSATAGVTVSVFAETDAYGCRRLVRLNSR